MTAKDLLEEERYGYDHFTKLTSTGINPDEDNIAEFAEYYLRRNLKLLGIADVVVQKETLCDCGKEYTNKDKEHGMCHKCWSEIKE